MLDLALEKLELAYSADGPLASFMARQGRSYTPSKPQYDYAVQCLRTFFGERSEKGAPVTLLEAETGTGKSLGYLVPLALYCALMGRRGAVSTHTLQLLDQLVQSDLLAAQSAVQELTGKRVTFGKRIGIRNWLSEPRIRRMQEVIRGDRTAEKGLFDYLEDLAGFAGDRGSLVEWIERNGNLPQGLNARDLTLASSDDPGSEAYRAHVSSSHDYDIIVVSHALVAVDLVRFGAVLVPEGVKPIDAIVIDEADTLAGVIRSQLQVHLSSHQLLEAALFMKGANRKRFEALVEEFKAATAAGSASAHNSIRTNGGARRMINLGDGRNETERKEFSGLADRLLSELRAGIKAIGKHGFVDELDDLMGYEAELKSFASACEQMSEYKIPSITYSPVLSIPAFNVFPMDASKIATRMWRAEKDSDETMRASVVLTSATLGPPSANDSFLSFMMELGLNDRYHNVRLDLSGRFAPERFGKMTFNLAGPAAPKPTLFVSDDEREYQTNPAWIDYCARTLDRVISLPGRTLVLSNSYADALLLSEALGARDLVILHRQGESLADPVSRFKALEDSVLISPACWEGLNLPGLIKHLVVMRLPIQNAGSSLLGMYREVLTSRGLDEESAVRRVRGMATNDALRKLKQGLGRGIRKADDQCEVWVLDPRFPMPERVASAQQDKYYRRFEMAIPERFRSKPLVATYPRAKLILAG